MKAASLASIRDTGFLRLGNNKNPKIAENKVNQAKNNYLVLPTPNTSPLAQNTESFVTQLALGLDKRIMERGKLKSLCEQYQDFHLGFIPQDILGQSEPKELFQFFDELIPQLKNKNQKASVQEKIASKGFKLSKVGGGEIADVYCLENKEGKKYALKVYFSNKEEESHGSWRETGTGLYCTGQPIKDISHLHFGNPEIGYNLYEWLDSETNISLRNGRTLFNDGLYCGDEKDENSIKGVLCDHGAIDKLKEEERQVVYIGRRPISLLELDRKLKKSSQNEKEILEDFQALWKNIPTAKSTLILNLDLIDNPSLKKQIIEEIITKDSLTEVEIHFLDHSIALALQEISPGEIDGFIQKLQANGINLTELEKTSYFYQNFCR